MSPETPESVRKAQIDALLLKLPGVSARRLGGVDAYFVSDKLFACVGDKGLGLRLPAATATELQFSCAYVGPYSPGGMATTREWVQIMRDDPADVGLDPYGAGQTNVGGGAVSLRGMSSKNATITAREVVTNPTFWLLCGTFFVCGGTAAKRSGW